MMFIPIALIFMAILLKIAYRRTHEHMFDILANVFFIAAAGLFIILYLVAGAL